MKHTRTIRLLAVVLAAVWAVGCDDTERDPERLTTVESGPEGNLTLHLYVSNQSFDIDPVDIDVYVDDVHVVTGDFRVESQHNWLLFDLYLKPGAHTLRAVGDGGDVTLQETFEMASERWAVVDFWYYATPQGGAGPTPRQFSFQIQDEPIGFK